MKAIENFLRQILFLLCLGISTVASSRDITANIKAETWNNSYGSEIIRQNASKNISLILTAIDNAASMDTEINYDDVEITAHAKVSLNRIWNKVSHFNIDNAKMNVDCLKSGMNFQIRDINVTIANPNYNKERDRAIVISFNKQGVIESVMLQPLDFDTSAFMRDGAGVVETDQRLQILQYVERFRLYYETKNINALEEIFSEDALIITGVRTEVIENSALKDKRNPIFNKGIKYSVKKKEEYIKNLRKLFDTTQSINVAFSDIKVERHRKTGKYYAVSLRQLWQSKYKNGRSYMDDGSLFLLWDFTDPDKPLINIRKWSDINDNTSIDDIQLK